MSGSINMNSQSTLQQTGSATQYEQTSPGKRKREETTDSTALVRSMKKLRLTKESWKLFDEMEWDDESGKLNGMWDFKGAN